MPDHRPLPAPFVLAMILALAVPIAAPARATVLRRLSAAELAQNAELAVLGRTTGVASSRVGGVIVTDTYVAVTACLKGECPETLAFRQLGGEVGGLGLHVEGALRTAPGEELAVFLRRGADAAWRLVGMAQGAFQVRRGPAEPLAVRDLSGTVVWDGARLRPGDVEMLPLEALAALAKGLDHGPRPRPARPTIR